ncbi:hypothetical protein GQR58_018380 [Nymphon striatum]|nr:hypothetical protein GQR58_018380 [Nymphon striatum]
MFILLVVICSSCFCASIKSASNELDASINTVLDLPADERIFGLGEDVDEASERFFFNLFRTTKKPHQGYGSGHSNHGGYNNNNHGGYSNNNHGGHNNNNNGGYGNNHGSQQHGKQPQTIYYYGNSGGGSSYGNNKGSGTSYGGSHKGNSYGDNKGSGSSYGGALMVEVVKESSYGGDNKGSGSSYGGGSKGNSYGGDNKGSGSSYGGGNKGNSYGGDNKGSGSSYGGGNKGSSYGGDNKGSGSSYGGGSKGNSYGGDNKGSGSSYGGFTGGSYSGNKGSGSSYGGSHGGNSYGNNKGSGSSYGDNKGSSSSNGGGFRVNSYGGNKGSGNSYGGSDKGNFFGSNKGTGSSNGGGFSGNSHGGNSYGSSGNSYGGGFRGNSHGGGNSYGDSKGSATSSGGSVSFGGGSYGSGNSGRWPNNSGGSERPCGTKCLFSTTWKPGNQHNFRPQQQSHSGQQTRPTQLHNVFQQNQQHASSSFQKPPQTSGVGVTQTFGSQTVTNLNSGQQSSGGQSTVTFDNIAGSSQNTFQSSGQQHFGNQQPGQNIVNLSSGQQSSGVQSTVTFDNIAGSSQNTFQSSGQQNFRNRLPGQTGTFDNIPGSSQDTFQSGGQQHFGNKIPGQTVVNLNSGQQSGGASTFAFGNNAGTSQNVFSQKNRTNQQNFNRPQFIRVPHKTNQFFQTTGRPTTTTQPFIRIPERPQQFKRTPGGDLDQSSSHQNGHITPDQKWSFQLWSKLNNQNQQTTSGFTVDKPIETNESLDYAVSNSSPSRPVVVSSSQVKESGSVPSAQGLKSAFFPGAITTTTTTTTTTRKPTSGSASVVDLTYDNTVSKTNDGSPKRGRVFGPSRTNGQAVSQPSFRAGTAVKPNPKEFHFPFGRPFIVSATKPSGAKPIGNVGTRFSVQSDNFASSSNPSTGYTLSSSGNFERTGGRNVGTPGKVEQVILDSPKLLPRNETIEQFFTNELSKTRLTMKSRKSRALDLVSVASRLNADMFFKLSPLADLPETMVKGLSLLQIATIIAEKMAEQSGPIHQSGDESRHQHQQRPYLQSVLTVNGNRIIQADQPVETNGIIHLIDGVLFPISQSNLYNTISSCNKFGNFKFGLSNSDLEDLIKTGGPFTIFIPTDEAFEALPASHKLLLSSNSTIMTDLLRYHIVNGVHYGETLEDGQYLSTINEERPLMVGVRSSQNKSRLVTVNRAQVLRSDLSTRNGVIHIIDRVLDQDELEFCQDDFV